MITETVVNILLDARRHADAETPSPTVDFTPDAELLRYFNAAYKKLIDMIVSSGDGAISLLLTSTTFATPYTMPADFYRVVGVDFQDSNGDWRALKPFNFRLRNRKRSDQFPTYRVEANQVVLSPSTAVPTLRLWYVANGGTIASNGSISTFNGWDDFIAYDVAMEILGKEERDISVAKLRRDEAAGRVMEACNDLNAGDTATIVDVERTSEDLFDFWA